MQPVSSASTVRLGGSYSIDRAAEVFAALSSALAGGRSVEIDVSGVEELDLSSLQAIYAASRSARSKGGTLSFVGTVPEKACARLAAAGFSAPGPLSGAEFGKGLPGFAETAK